MAARDQMADHVVLVRGRARVRPHLGNRDIAGAVARGNPQHEVGEGEVGEQLPLRDQQMQPLEIGVTESGVLAYEVVHGGHVCERTRRIRPDPGQPPAAGSGAARTAPETPAGRGAWEGPSTLPAPQPGATTATGCAVPIWPKRGAGAVRAESAGSSVRLPVRGRRRLVQFLKALWTRPWSCVHVFAVHASADVCCRPLLKHPRPSIRLARFGS